MKKTLTLIAAVIALNAPLSAEDSFDLNSLQAGDIITEETLKDIPEPSMGLENKAPNALPALDLSLKLPFAELNKRLATMDISKVKPLNPSAPLLSRKGDSIVFDNFTINYGGMDVEPVIILKPFFEGKNMLAIKVQKIEADIAFGPTKSLFSTRIDKNGVMELAMTKITEAVTTAMDEALAKNKVALRAKDLLSFKYEKESWTLHMAINPTFISPLMPGLISNINLSAFSFDDKGFTIKAGFNSELIQPDPTYNLSLSDGLLTAFIKKFTDGSDFELLPKGHAGGLKFREDGVIELSGKFYARDVFLKPNVYFTATVVPTLTSANTIRMRVDKINIDQAYGIGLPGFINGWLQGKIISSTVDSIINNPGLNKTMTARKIDDKTVELTLSNASFLPSFARGVTIKGLKVKKGLLYLGFEF